MKKAFVALMVVATALVAQANVWNINWFIAGALAPEDTVGDMSISLFENYDITWDLINATAGDTVIKSATMVGGTVMWDDTEVEGGVIGKYGDFLMPSSLSTTYLGYTEETTEQSIYQKITLVSKTTGEEFEWVGEQFAVTPKANGQDNPADLDVTTVIAAEGVSFDGLKMATWTKVTAVPEPATMSLLGLGALAMVLRRRIRR